MCTLEEIKKITLVFKRYCDLREEDGFIGSNETLWIDFEIEVLNNESTINLYVEE